MKLGTDRRSHSARAAQDAATAGNAAGEDGGYGALSAGVEEHTTARQKRGGCFDRVCGGSDERSALASETGQGMSFPVPRGETPGRED
jgi:hypothetical protein